MIFTLGILDPETTFDSSVGFNFFARLFLFLRYLTFLFLHAPFLHRRLLLHRPSACPFGPWQPRTLFRRPREPSSFPPLAARLFAPYPFASSPFCALHRSCAHALPCFSRHFSPSRRAGVHLVSPSFRTFPSSSPAKRRRFSGSSTLVSGDSLQVATVRELIRLCGLSSTISHPVRSDLHRATKDRIETPLKREGDNR